MKAAFTRFLIYLFTLVLLSVIFSNPSNTASPLPNSALAGKVGFYVGHYGVGFVFWMLVFEAVFRIARRVRRSAQSKDDKGRPGN